MPNYKQIELLCPAKDNETGIAAIKHGADAVYIGFTSFGAREAAGNSLADIEKLIAFAHLYHARVYITLNTILYDNELEKVQRLIQQLYQMGADAIIIQDMGILEMDLPPIPLHASTQTNNVTVEKIKFLQDIGIQRVILARELSVEQISRINNSTSVELEAFIHGALCVSYSGQCYMSYATTGRSANRGECAQSCRLKYDLVDEKGKVLVHGKHLLSLKDFNQTQNIANLIDAGISSLKVEGRLKDIGYVKNITAHYRRIIDDVLEQRPNLKKSSSGRCTYLFTPDPNKTFNRGYTTYFSHGRAEAMASFDTPKSMGKMIGEVKAVFREYIAIESDEPIHNNDGLCFINKNNALVGFKVNGVDGEKVIPNQAIGVHIGAAIYRNYDHQFAQQLMQNNSADRRVDCELMVGVDEERVTLQLTDEDGIITIQQFSIGVEPAKNGEQMLDTLQRQLLKTGNSPYRINSIAFSKTPSFIPYIPVGAINGFRRDLLDLHGRNRIARHKISSNKIVPNSIPYFKKKLDYKANVTNSLSEKFYKRHNVSSIDEGFELIKSPRGNTLMTTKYCLLYEMNLCDGKGQKDRRKLFLQDSTRSYPLHFDCQRCEMHIRLPAH
ncbi:MAG: U32 family peptidase [Tenuifilaceae bacterium]|nr:U32 family peptidase [Tenuifilaceae bacterium]